MKIGNLLVEGDNQKIVYIPEGITHIGAGAFIGCRDLEVLYLPDSLVEIGRRAFEYCDSLKTIRFGKGLQTIGEKAFFECEKLEKINLPGSVVWIGKKAFMFCDNLKKVHIGEIGNYIERIASLAFAFCDNLEEVLIKKRVKGWGSEVFSYTPLKEFVFPDMPEMDGDINESMFSGCSELERVVLPRNLKDLGYETFNGCTKLQEVVRKDGQWEEIEDDKIQEFFDNLVETAKKDNSSDK